MTGYIQCRLKKGDKETTTWIPKKYAQKGRGVVLKRNDVWDEGWVIIDTGTYETSNTHSAEYAVYRKPVENKEFG